MLRGYGGLNAVYGNLSGVNSDYIGGSPSALKNSWSGQTPGFVGAGYGSHHHQPISSEPIAEDKSASTNMKYIDEASKMEEEIQEPIAEDKSAATNPERSSYWEELLKDRYEVHKVEEFNSMGKAKRSRKQMVSVEDNDLAGLEDVSCDADDNYEAELSVGENPAGITSVKKPSRKKTCVDNSELLPLMEGEGRAFRVLVFNQTQWAQFVQILMSYGTLFLSHISEDITDAATFSDGVPKEGLRIKDVLVRIAVLLLVRYKVKNYSEYQTSPLFTEDIIYRYPGLRGLKF
ncbi:hypothetical protein L1887_16037 [Cichorium endivia]|nr:hypothetical protein L1887_16037 [Cichorium endivia]